MRLVEAGKNQITMLFDNPKGVDFTLKNFRNGNHRVRFTVRSVCETDKGELI